MGARETRPDPRARLLRIAVIAGAALVVAIVTAVAVPLLATSTPEFFSRYHLLERRYVNLSGSAHEGIACRTCHETNALKNGFQLIGDFYASTFKRSETPRYFSFEPPTNAACLRCHEEDWSDDASATARIPHPAHQRVAAETRSCSQCHKWTAHLEAYLDKHKEMPFSGVCVAYGCHVGTKTAEQCFDCHHVLHEDGDQWRTEHPRVIKRTGQNVCMEGCHTVDECRMCHTTGKRPDFQGVPIEVGMRSIETLHVQEDWTERYHGGEALKNENACLTCHQTEGECAECHRDRPDSHGPTSSWIGRHKKHSTAVDDPRCLTCHTQDSCDECHEQFKEME